MIEVDAPAKLTVSLRVTGVRADGYHLIDADTPVCDGLALHDALAQGKRCIRVIHGKGHGSPGKVSILKQLSRGWLAQREEILAFCQAGPHDGGGGALLVLLRAHNAAPRS